MTLDKEPSYKQLQDELHNIMEQIQSDNIAIDEALNLHKEAVQIIQKLEKHLINAKNEIEHLKSV